MVKQAQTQMRKADVFYLISRKINQACRTYSTATKGVTDRRDYLNFECAFPTSFQRSEPIKTAYDR